MNKWERLRNAAAFGGALLSAACGNSGDGGGSSMTGPKTGGSMTGQPATETNAAPVPCTDDSACPQGIKCVVLEPGSTGHCDVSEMGASGDEALPVSSAAPAPCTQDSDCGMEIACTHFEGDSGPGFCDVNEMVGGGSGAAGSGD